MIVLDASAALEVLLRTPRAAAIEARIFAPGETLHAPHLIDIEVAHVIRRYVLGGAIPEARGREALEDFAALRLHRYPHEPSLLRIWELRHNVRTYDAAYVVVAEELGAPLVTHDAALRATRGHGAAIELV